MPELSACNLLPLASQGRPVLPEGHLQAAITTSPMLSHFLLLVMNKSLTGFLCEKEKCWFYFSFSFSSLLFCGSMVWSL